MSDVLSTHDARTRLVEIRRLRASKNPSAADPLVAELKILIFDTLSKHGDQRTRALMAVFAEMIKDG